MHPPADVLASGREEPRWTPPRWARPAATVVVVAAVAGAAVVAATRGEDAGPAPVPATLSVVGDAIAVSQAGVMVVPVVLRNPGDGLRLRSAEITAAPVRTASLVTAPDAVPAGDSRRLAVIVDPDCAVIGPGVGGELVATLVVRVVSVSGDEQDLRASIGRAPAVQSLLEGLCGDDRAPVLGDPDAAAVQELLQDEALEVGLEVRMDLSRG